jgi:hypothetical protein
MDGNVIIGGPGDKVVRNLLQTPETQTSLI